jgi:flavin reductase (DIM6/NTAB) family NADH-FMN oxidoreductase RutF
MHIPSKPSILYFGTPVAVLSTTNENGSNNLAPMSSIFWLGWRCIIGLNATSKTTQNLIRTGECVINLPSFNEVGMVNKLAKTTGSNPVPDGKQISGYEFVEDKFGISGFTPQASETVSAQRVRECPVQMEAVVAAVHGLADEDPIMRGAIKVFELRIKAVHAEESILENGKGNHIDPDKWKPLIMSFQQFYSLGGRLQHSTLAEIPEHLYNTPDREKTIQQPEPALS